MIYNVGAIAGVAAARRNSSTDLQYLPIDRTKYERPIVGSIKITSTPIVTVIPDMVNDGVDIRFRDIAAIHRLIDELTLLKDKMEDLKGEEK